MKKLFSILLHPLSALTTWDNYVEFKIHGRQLSEAEAEEFKRDFIAW